MSSGTDSEICEFSRTVDYIIMIDATIIHIYCYLANVAALSAATIHVTQLPSQELLKDKAESVSDVRTCEMNRMVTEFKIARHVFGNTIRVYRCLRVN